MTSNDNDALTPGGMPAQPDAQGQAALVLVESLLHGLMEQSVLSLRQTVEIIDAAIEVQTDVADAADGSAEAMWRSHSILSAMAASLKRDMDDPDIKPG